MNSSELKPKLLAILFKFFEVDPRPSAGGTIESLLPAIKGTTPEEILGMMQHLEHVGLIDIRDKQGYACASINDKGIRWLNEHNEYLKEKSMKHWLGKPLIVGTIKAIIVLIVGIIIGVYSPYIKNMFPQPQADNQPEKLMKPKDKTG